MRQSKKLTVILSVAKERLFENFSLERWIIVCKSVGSEFWNSDIFEIFSVSLVKGF